MNQATGYAGTTTSTTSLSRSITIPGRASLGRGSAVFIHVARDAFGPTAGCVALRRNDLLKLAFANRAKDKN